MRRALIFMFVVLIWPIPAISAEPLRVAVAANFLHTAQALAGLYTRQSGEEISLSNGSSGTLYAQISNGAPYDLFLSADQARPLQLVAAGQALRAEPYALGLLTLVSRGGGGKPEKLLASGRLAIADPSVAPYGQAALEVLNTLGFTPADLNLVYAGNVGQTASWYVSGNVDLALVSASLAQGLASGDGMQDETRLIPMARYHTPVAQYAAVLNHDPRAGAFLELMKSTEGQTIILAAGYLLPEGSP